MSIPAVIKFNGERTSDNRCLKFDIKWMDGDNTKEPIYSFLDFSEKSINDSFSIFAKNIYKTYKGDKCWFCSTNVCIQNNCVCKHHYKKCNWFIEHFNNIVQDDFDYSELVLENNDEPSSPQNFIEPILSPPRLHRMKINDNINFDNVNPRNINLENDHIEDFEIIEGPEETEFTCPAPPRLRRGDFEKLKSVEDDNIIFTMI